MGKTPGKIIINKWTSKDILSLIEFTMTHGYEPLEYLKTISKKRTYESVISKLFKMGLKKNNVEEIFKLYPTDLSKRISYAKKYAKQMVMDMPIIWITVKETVLKLKIHALENTVLAIAKLL